MKKQALKTATLHTSCKIVSINIDEARVILDDGREFRGDLLLGADGVHVSPDRGHLIATG